MDSDSEKFTTEFHFLSLFPEMIETYLSTSILGRARKNGLFHAHTHQLRDFSTNSYGTVDDVAFGGGGGMVLKVDVLAAALESLQAQYPAPHRKVVYFSPRGSRLEQSFVEEAAATPTQWIFVCGHYEGVDQRFIDAFVDLEISLGDFVITGGELPAMAFADALARQLEGTVKHENGAATESFSLQSKSGKRLLEYPHYTRPRSFRGMEVPDVLLSGNHSLIEKWRQKTAEETTLARRPDLLD